MAVATHTTATWRTVIGEAVGPARFVVDLEGARGEWRQLLERNGYVLLDPAHALRGAVHGAVIARHLVSRVRDPQRFMTEWLELLEPGGRVVLLESGVRRGTLGGLFQRPTLLFPPSRPFDPRAQYRRGLSPADASLLLQAAGYVDVRTFALPVPRSVGVHYLVSARRR
jgi:hypothetical protein